MGGDGGERERERERCGERHISTHSNSPDSTHSSDKSRKPQLTPQEKMLFFIEYATLKAAGTDAGSHAVARLCHAWGVNGRFHRDLRRELEEKGMLLERRQRSDAGLSIINSYDFAQKNISPKGEFKRAQRKKAHDEGGHVPTAQDLEAEWETKSTDSSFLELWRRAAQARLNRQEFIRGEIIQFLGKQGGA